LRINADGTIPADNPFTGSEIARKVWALGLHNPRTPEVDAHAGRIFINDACANSWEEINDITNGGGNFGWPRAEGFSTEAAYENPVHTYPQGNSTLITNETVAGGTFFNPVATAFPAKYTGKYFFTDGTKRWIGFLDLNNPSIRYSFATDLTAECNFIKAGTDGNLYYLSKEQNAVYRIVYKGPDTVEYYQGNATEKDAKATLRN
jgi:glucose/arabinose dehydrogenase